MKKKYELLFITIFILLIAILTVFTSLNFTKNKITCIDNIKIFNNFNMANELKITEEKNFNTLKFNLGSLYSKLRSSGLPNLDKKSLITLFITKKEELNQFHTSFGSIQSSKIWTRIKSCSSEFSKENECQLLMGSVNKTKNLFTAKNIDVKSNLITYNQKV